MQNMQAAGKKLKKASKKHKKQQTDKTSKHIDKYNKDNSPEMTTEAIQQMKNAGWEVIEKGDDKVDFRFKKI